MVRCAATASVDCELGQCPLCRLRLVWRLPLHSYTRLGGRAGEVARMACGRQGVSQQLNIRLCGGEGRHVPLAADEHRGVAGGEEVGALLGGDALGADRQGVEEVAVELAGAEPALGVEEPLGREAVLGQAGLLQRLGQGQDLVGPADLVELEPPDVGDPVAVGVLGQPRGRLDDLLQRQSELALSPRTSQGA